jgi:dCTP deaminase
MGVLSKEQIFDRLSRSIDKASSLVISPLLQAKSVFDTESIDLRLGTHFLLPQLPPQPFFFPGTESSRLGHQRVHIPLGRYLVVPAHQTVLGATLEFIKLPHDVSGQILTKSSVARTFVVIETAPWIHPEYRGCLTLEIANVSNTPLLLYPGRLVAQMILFEVPEAKASTQWTGTYMGPVYPEAPTFLDPAEDLKKIGIRSTRKPKVGHPPQGRCPDCLATVVSGDARCRVCSFEFRQG